MSRNFTLIRCREYLNVTPKSDRLLTAPKDKRLLDDGGSSSSQSPQVWNHGLIDQAHIEDLAIELTGIIYQRLFKNPPTDMTNSKRVYTLPGGDISKAPQEVLSVSMASEGGSSEQSKAASSSSGVVSLPKVHDAAMQQRSTQRSRPSQPKSGTSLAEEINEHLHEMNLEQLSDAEAQALHEIGLSGFLLEDSNGPPEHRTARPGDAESRHQRSEDPHIDPLRNFGYGLYAPKFDPITGLSMATSIFELVDVTLKIALKASSINRSTKRASAELEILRLRVEWHSHLLYVVAEELRDQNRHIGSTYGLVVGLISESERAFRAAGSVTDRHAMKRAGWIFNKRSNRKAAIRAIKELESLKLNLIMMLQLLRDESQRQSVPGLYAPF